MKTGKVEKTDYDSEDKSTVKTDEVLTSAPEAATDLQEPAKPQAAEAVIYCGPSIQNAVKQYSVFTGDLPKDLADRIKSTPAIGKLIVPVSKLKEMQKNIGTKGSAENVFYNKIMEGANS